MQAGEQGFCAAHGESGDGAGVAVFLHQIGRLDARDNFGEQRLAKLVKVSLGNRGIAKNSGIGRENFGLAITERHDDEHGLGFALRDETVEDHIAAADGGQSACVVAIAVQEIENWVSLFSARVIARRGVDKKVAIIADYAGLIEMAMNFAVREGP